MRTTESFRDLKRMQVIKAARHGSKSALFVSVYFIEPLKRSKFVQPDAD